MHLDAGPLGGTQGANLCPDKYWQSIDRLIAIRLLGRQPTEAVIDRNVALIFIASDGLNGPGNSAFNDLLSDLTKIQLKRFRRNMERRFPEFFCIEELADCRRLLIELVDLNIGRLDQMVEEFEHNAESTAAAVVSGLKCNETPEAYRLLNYIKTSRRALNQGIAAYEKYSKRAQKEDDERRQLTGEHGGWTPRRLRSSGDGMGDDVDLAWATRRVLLAIKKRRPTAARMRSGRANWRRLITCWTRSWRMTSKSEAARRANPILMKK